MLNQRTPARAVALAGVTALTLVGGSVVRPGAPQPARAADTRPNVLLILTDDQRFEGAGGPAGFLAYMPNVKKYMQDQGELFPNAFATTSLCMPSRGALMTGRYAHNTGVTMNGNNSPETVYDQSTTIQSRLQHAGYKTALVGKYFNTWPKDKTPPSFDQFALTKGGYFNAGYNVNGVLAARPGYTVTVTGNYAAQFLQTFHSQSPDQPWYMEIAPQAPHDPYTPDTKYQSTTFPAWSGNPATNETDRSDKPPVVRSRTATLAQGKTRRVQQLRTLKSVDDMVGRVMTTLQTLGELQNTIVIYAADNGYMWAEHGILDKRFPYEQSVKVPLLMRWPGHVTGGTRATKLVALLDIAPTVMNATGTSFDPAMMDGHDLLGPFVRDRLLLEYFRSNDVLGIPGWRGLWTPSSEFVQWTSPTGDGDFDADDITFREYYNLQTDPWQLTNLLGDRSTTNDPNVTTLAQQLAAAYTCKGPTCP